MSNSEKDNDKIPWIPCKATMAALIERLGKDFFEKYQKNPEDVIDNYYEIVYVEKDEEKRNQLIEELKKNEWIGLLFLMFLTLASIFKIFCILIYRIQSS